MSAIPPGWLASGIQSTGAQQRAVQARDKEAVTGPGGVQPFARQLDSAIETGDKDAQVDAEAQGNGGQGRQGATSSDDAPTPEEPPRSDQPQAGGSLDIQA